MTRFLLGLTLALFAVSAAAQDNAVKTSPTGTVSISAGGTDVRAVVHSLFTQAKKNYVLEPLPFKALHLSLNDVDFEEALQLVCKLGQFTYEVQNGIYFITRPKPPVAPPKAAEPAPVRAPASASAEVKGTLPSSALAKKVTTRFMKTDMRAVFAEFAKQTGLTIEVDKNVPAYRVDAFLINTSLKFSLDRITKAAGLKYRLTDRQSIEIYRPESAQAEQGRVTVEKAGI